MFEPNCFDGLLCGPSNRFALAAAASVAEHPGQVYNPLWIYGPSGTGKTVLLNAAAARLKARCPQLLVARVNAEQLVREMVNSIQTSSTPQFRERYLRADVLLVDHLDYLGGMPTIQTELGHLFAEAASRGHQVILASSCAMPGLSMLRSCLEHRCPYLLLADTLKPDPEERSRMAHLMAQCKNLELSEAMARKIAAETQSPAQVQCIVTHLAARKQLLQLDATGLEKALELLLRNEVVA